MVTKFQNDIIIRFKMADIKLLSSDRFLKALKVMSSCLNIFNNLIVAYNGTERMYLF